LVHPPGTGVDQQRFLAHSQEDIEKQIAGVWRLVSNSQRFVDGGIVGSAMTGDLDLPISRSRFLLPQRSDS